MPNYKEIALYGAMAVVIIAIVLFVVSSLLQPSSYSVQVRLSQQTQNTTIYPYQTAQYQINITNTGHGPIKDMLVGFYLDGSSQSTNTISLPAGQSIILKRNYTYPTAGTYSFQAVADPSDLLNILNRSAAQSTLTTNITPAEIPNVFTSIPNTNISGIQSFALSGTGGLSTAAVAQRYNVSLVNRFFGPGENLSEKIFENVYPYTGNVYGAYAQYNDNTIAYTAWLQGTVNPQVVEFILSSFKDNLNHTSIGQFQVTKINKTTSMCVFYSSGWTKIISYYNNSKPGTCASIAAYTYNPTESNTIINLIKTNATITHFQSGLFYTNSTILGSSVYYSANSLTAINVFNNDFGLFIGSVQKLVAPRSSNSLASNSTCYGLIYSRGNTHVCTYLIPTRTGNYSLPFGLTNSTYLAQNYTIGIYSLVNNTQLVAAHNNAANLLNALGVNESSIPWGLQFMNSCVFANASIGCTFRNFFRTNSTAQFNITNMFNSNIRVNQLNCELLPGFSNVTVNTIIPAGKSAEFTQLCNNVAIPTASALTNYLLIMNYTYRNSTKIVTGSFNVTNQGIS